MGDDISIQKVYNNYEKGWNGRMKMGSLPEEQKKVTYPHPNKPGEMTSQNYLEYDDLAVAVLVRKCKNGQFQFGLIEQEAPAFIPRIKQIEDQLKNCSMSIIYKPKCKVLCCGSKRRK